MGTGSALPSKPQSNKTGIVAHLISWWHVYGAAITSAGVLLLPALQQAVAANPKVSTVVAAIAVIAAKLSPSPVK
jgi:hypothetical protein